MRLEYQKNVLGVQKFPITRYRKNASKVQIAKNLENTPVWRNDDFNFEKSSINIKLIKTRCPYAPKKTSKKSPQVVNEFCILLFVIK